MTSYDRILKKWYKKGIYDLKREQGICYRCHTKCEVNPKTGKLFTQCTKHRVYSNKVSSLYKKACRAIQGKKPSFRAYN